MTICAWKHCQLRVLFLVVGLIGLMLIAVSAGIGRFGQGFQLNLCYLELARAVINSTVPVSACFKSPGGDNVQASYGWAMTHIARQDLAPVLLWLDALDYPQNSRQESLWIAIAQEFFRRGNIQQMILAWKEVGYWQRPEMAEKVYVMAQQAVAEGRAQVGEALYRIVVDMDSADPQLRIKLASVLLEQYDDKKGAAEQLLRVSDPDALSFQEVMTVAVLLRQVGQYQEARKWVAHANAMDSSSMEPRLELGIIAMFEGNYQEQEQIAMQVLEIDPNNARAYTQLGVAYAAQGYLDQAITAEKRAVLLDPTANWSYNLLAAYLRQKGNLTEAEEAARQSVRLAPHQVSYVVLLADILTDQGRDDEAIVLYQRALQMHGADLYLTHIQSQLEILEK
ncbi:MAG: hypothetical protein C0401_07355 [Anaerolinea sp.]|nr:hypothetical protein [Anaerolinea sp.]